MNKYFENIKAINENFLLILHYSNLHIKIM